MKLERIVWCVERNGCDGEAIGKGCGGLLILVVESRPGNQQGGGRDVLLSV